VREKLVERVRGMMAQAGFAVSEPLSHRPISFDFLARRDENFYILKVLTNIDSLSEEVAREMRILARFLNGRPLLVGMKASSAPLEAGAVYVRHGIPILSVEGLKDYLIEGAPPMAFAAPGGFCVKLDGEKLHAIRQDENLSLGQLADVAGVSRRTISMYEDGMSATVEAALRLEEFLERPLIRPIDPFARTEDDEEPAEPNEIEDVSDPYTRSIFDLLSEMGFGIVPTGRSPFHGIGLVDPAEYDPSDPSEALLLTAASKSRSVEDRAALLRSVSTICERTALFITGDDKEGPHGTAFVKKEKLDRFEEVEGLVELARERGESGEEEGE
jgi:putative transcriptional regulator